MSTVATDLRRELEDHFTSAVLTSFREMTSAEAYRVHVDDQSRHKGRMATATVTLFGDGWIGSASLMVPAETARAIVIPGQGPPEPEVLEEIKKRPVRGTAVADELGALVAASALRFGEGFSGESKLTVGPPTVVIGDACAITFPWGQPFETRLCFEGIVGSFWAVLRLSQMSR